MAKVIEEKIKQLLNRNTHSKERNIIILYQALILQKLLKKYKKMIISIVIL